MAKNKVAIVRGAFLNPFELQNFYPLVKGSLDGVHTERSRSARSRGDTRDLRDDKGEGRKYDLRAISSMHPISEDIEIPLTKTYALTDLPNFPFKYQIINRLAVDAHYLLGLEQLLRGFDIAHVAETYYHYTIQAINAKKKGYVKKVISTVWEIIPNNNEGIWGRKRFKRIAREGVDHFIAVTELAKKALLEEGVDEKKISVIPMGVDLKRFQPGKFNEKVMNILCVSRLVPEKGMGELAEAFRGLSKKYPNLKLTVVGGGQLPYSQIHEEYQRADIFCLPSKTTKYWQEQYGMALVEAMACGLPIVTTKTGAIGEVCGDAAIYAKPADTNDLQSKLERLIESESSRAIFAEKSLARAKARYDCTKTAKAIDALYQKVLWE